MHAPQIMGEKTTGHERTHTNEGSENEATRQPDVALSRCSGACGTVVLLESYCARHRERSRDRPRRGCALRCPEAPRSRQLCSQRDATVATATTVWVSFTLDRTTDAVTHGQQEFERRLWSVLTTTAAWAALCACAAWTACAAESAVAAPGSG